MTLTKMKLPEDCAEWVCGCILDGLLLKDLDDDLTNDMKVKELLLFHRKTILNFRDTSEKVFDHLY